MEQKRPILPAIINGWHYPMEVFREAHNDNKLVKLLMELGNRCNLLCEGCFTKRRSDRNKQNPNAMDIDEKLELLEEARRFGARSVDIVGSGEPTLDPNFRRIIDKIRDLGMDVLVFTSGATSLFQDKFRLAEYQDISFGIKLWSRNERLQDLFVGKQGYTAKREKALENLGELGFMNGEEITIDGVQHRFTRVLADILVRKENIIEIPDLHRFCREMNVQPETKLFIPNISGQDSLSLNSELTLEQFIQLREIIEGIDSNKYGIPPLASPYIQGSKCTQSIGALYVTDEGAIHSCVGTTNNDYGTYKSGFNMLQKALRERVERVGFGCFPRFEKRKSLGLSVPKREEGILTMQ